MLSQGLGSIRRKEQSNCLFGGCSINIPKLITRTKEALPPQCGGGVLGVSGLMEDGGEAKHHVYGHSVLVPPNNDLVKETLRS